MAEKEHEETNQPEPENLALVNRPVSEHPITSAFRYLYEIIKTAVVVLLIALIIRSFLIQPYIVDGSSMEPTFHNNEYLLVGKHNPITKNPVRGDIIVFRYPLNPSLNYVKRVIGQPGDRVVIAKGQVTIFNNEHTDGMLLHETYLQDGQQTLVNGDTREYSWVVDDNNYFVMGDNRDHSDDSRSWGLVPEKNLVGRVWLTLYPTSDFGVVHHARY